MSASSHVLNTWTGDLTGPITVSRLRHSRTIPTLDLENRIFDFVKTGRKCYIHSSYIMIHISACVYIVEYDAIFFCQASFQIEFASK